MLIKWRSVVRTLLDKVNRCGRQLGQTLPHYGDHRRSHNGDYSGRYECRPFGCESRRNRQTQPDRDRGVPRKSRQIAGAMKEMPIVLITMTGAKTGRTLTRPLCYSRD